MEKEKARYIIDVLRSKSKQLTEELGISQDAAEIIMVNFTKTLTKQLMEKRELIQIRQITKLDESEKHSYVLLESTGDSNGPKTFKTEVLTEQQYQDFAMMAKRRQHDTTQN